MTKINWERESGDAVQEFVAALILLRFKRGNLITPSRGDRGVDVRVERENGLDVYQVKRYGRRLTSTQKKDIKESWDTFLEQTASVLPINSWKLVLPWNPSNEALEWLDEVTAGSDIPHEWIGRTQLDTWAAENPRLVDYYFGDGADRLQELVAQALLAGREAPQGEPGEALLGAVTERALSLQTALDEIDPFYRYEIEVRAGRIPDADAALVERTGAVLTSYEQVSETQYTATHIIARTPASVVLRPIKQQVHFTVKRGTAEAEALEQFRLYGKPFENMEAAVVETEGPPGSPSPGTGYFTFLASEGNAEGLPSLELRLVAVDGQVVATLPARNVQHSSGLGTGGHWVSVSDPAEILSFEFLFGMPGHDRTLIMKTIPPNGRRPAQVAATLRFVCQFSDSVTLVVGVEDGPAFLGPWAVQRDEIAIQAAAMLPLAEDLVTVQQHSMSRILMPAADQWKPGELPRLKRAARLLRGEELRDQWTHLTVTVEHPEALPALPASAGALRLQQALVVSVAGADITTDRMVQITYAPAQLAAGQDLSKVNVGAKVRFVGGEQAQAVSSALPLADL